MAPDAMGRRRLKSSGFGQNIIGSCLCNCCGTGTFSIGLVSSRLLVPIKLWAWLRNLVLVSALKGRMRGRRDVRQLRVDLVCDGIVRDW